MERSMTQEITPQDRGGEQWLDFDTLVVPYDLGKIEFLPPQEMFDRYAKVIGDVDAAFVTHAFRASTMMHSKLAPKPGEAQINSGHEAVYFNRPVPGKKLIMTGAIVEKYIKRDLPYIVVEMSVTDEDGRKIENVRHISMLKASGLGRKWWGTSLANVSVGTELAPVVKRFSREDMVEAEAIAALFGRSYETIHNDAEIARREGLKEIIGSGNDMASHVHELMKKFAGPDWVQGGTVSLRFIRPVVAGDVITYKGKVVEKQHDNGRTRVVVDVVGENQRGEAAVVGRASVLAA
jgi:acyl dehydratase